MYASESESPTSQAEKAFTLLYEYHYTDLRRIAYSILRDPIVAREAINNVFMRLWESNRFDQIENIKNYLRRAVRNEALSLIQASKRHKIKVEQDIIASICSTEPSAQQELEGQDCEKKMKIALDKLSPRQREVFIYARLHGLTHEKISQKMGISKHTVNEYVQEAQKKINHYMMNCFD